jgi:outer membrane protein OmpA-like peptidoglycan-associated protein
VLVEGFGATGFTSAPGTNSLEVDGALRLKLHDSAVVLTAGGGGGVITGVGVPAARAFLGFGYVGGTNDRDGDGVPDNLDKCPDVPAPHDDTWDGTGCPRERDTDGDGIPDNIDKCPTEPETFNGYQDDDGCPDELPDRDHDGIPDKDDKCPDAGGPDVIRIATSPYYGCPDRDHDGVPDYIDKCPDVPEPTDDLWDGSGCPHVRDTDGDGIPDDIDKCPTEPETYNGYKDDDGCPDTGPTTVEVTATSINIKDRVEFATGKDKIQGLKSFQVLDAVVGVMKGHGEIILLEVQGHTDDKGAADQNRVLSQKRAEAVMKYLASKGVDPKRLTAKGYGPDHPITFNTTAAGRQKNRRVEFRIVDSLHGKPAMGTPPPPLPVTTPPAPATPAPNASGTSATLAPGKPTKPAKPAKP